MSLSQWIKMRGDTTDFNKDVARAAEISQKAFKAVGKELSNRLIGAFTVSKVIDKVTDFARSIYDTADNIGDMADNLGMSVEEVQRLEIAAGRAGVKFSKIQSLVSTVQQKMSEAVSGDRKAISLFTALGIDPSKGSPLDVMKQAVEASSKGSDQMAAAIDLFGRRMPQIVNTIKELERLGPVKIFSESDITKMGKTLDAFKESWLQLMATVAPAFTVATDAVSASIKKTINSFDYALKQNTQEMTIFGKKVVVDMNPITGPTAYIPETQQQAQKPVQIQPTASNAGIPFEAIKGTPLSPSGDALSRIGLFVGGPSAIGDRLVTIGSFQVNLLRSIRDEMRKMNE